MGFANFALRHARGLFVALAVLVVLGVASIRSLPMSIYPKVGFARVVVVAQNGEMPPQQVQQNLSRHLEQPLSTIPGAQLVQSNSAQGAAQISITFDPRIDVNTDLQRVNAALGQHRNDIPPGTTVDAQIVNPNIFPVLGYTVLIPGKTLAETRTISEYQIKPVLTGIPGVAQVRTVGGRQKEYWVSVDPREAASFKLGLDKIGDAIAKSNEVTSVGHFNAFAQRQIVLVSGAPKSLEDISNIVVDTRTGVPVTVGQVKPCAPYSGGPGVYTRQFAHGLVTVDAINTVATIYEKPGANNCSTLGVRLPTNTKR